MNLRIASLITLVAFSLAVVFPAVATASVLNKSCEGIARGENIICDSKGENIDQNGGILKAVVDFLLMLAGFLAVIMIVVGGYKYMTSSGDAAKLTSAKNTILYSVIGLIVAILAFAIVQFVASEVFKI